MGLSLPLRQTLSILPNVTMPIKPNTHGLGNTHSSAKPSRYRETTSPDLPPTEAYWHRLQLYALDPLLYTHCAIDVFNSIRNLTLYMMVAPQSSKG